MRDKKKAQNDGKVPDYQLFPNGMWHMVAAVMLMIPVIAVLTALYSAMAESWMQVETINVSSLVLVMCLALMLSVPTGMIFFGKAGAHRFLLRLNGIEGATLILSAVFSVATQQWALASLSAIGVICVASARRLYQSKSFEIGKKHYRDIWEYRTKMRRKFAKLRTR